MNFEDILSQWENSPEGKKAVGNNRFLRIVQEKEEGLKASTPRKHSKGYLTGKSSLGVLKSMKAEASLDLHGIRAEEATTMVQNFLQESVRQGRKKVQIIHGRGLHSQQGKAILRDIVVKELQHSSFVRAYGNPTPAQGGTGVVWVILQRG